MVSKVGSFLIVFFLCESLLPASTKGDDATIMKQFASLVSPTPSGWNSTIHPCNWTGISCDDSWRVSEIRLYNLSLSGTLPSNLNSLSQLTSLSLDYNHFSGTLPSLSNLKLLKDVSLESNNFTSIANDAFAGLTNLESLSLNNNLKLRLWTFPTQLADSPRLNTFNAQSTNLKGSIPDIFSSFSALQHLDLSYNHLTGSLPPSFSQTPIADLTLSNQTVGLSGPIDVLANMTFMVWVWLDGNKFTGPIPDLSNCQKLHYVVLHSNLLTGIIPTSLSSLPRIVLISIHNNKLQGPLPVFGTDVYVSNITQGNSFCKDTPGPCDQQVMTLLQVAGALGYPLVLAEAWKGNNACKKWRFVQCNPSGKVINIDFSRKGFQGTIFPAFGNLTSLIELHLNGNNLTGVIPQSLTQLTHLRILNLSNNNILPPVPHFGSSVKIDISGNSHLLKSPSTNAPSELDSESKVRRSQHRTSIKITIVALLGGFITLIFATCFSIKLYKKKKQPSEQDMEAKQLENSSYLVPEKPVIFSYEVLKAATSNFDMNQKLGGGGFGSVFEGTLNNGTRVAVKKLECLRQGKKEFLAEVTTMGSIQHFNLARLLGFCAEKTSRLLVYEYMSNGSLDKWIFHNNSSRRLNWDMRRKIILHVAKGLAYLHEDCIKRIAHLDVKPQNVLLDEGFNAKISDFGLAKFIDRDQSHVMTQMRGTRGYLAPEWLDRKITEKADVYSYGVLVLEVVFERKNLDGTPSEESDNRLIHIVNKNVEALQLPDLLDKCSEDMKQKCQEVEKTIRVALWCLHMDPKRRPSMSMVVKVLEGAVSMDFVSDHDLLFSTDDKYATRDNITQVSDSLLSGPR